MDIFLVIIFISYLLLVFLVQTYHIFTLTCIFYTCHKCSSPVHWPKGSCELLPSLSFCHCLSCSSIYLFVLFTACHLSICSFTDQPKCSEQICMYLCYLYSIGNQQKKLDLLSSFSLLVKFLTVLVHVLKKDLFIWTLNSIYLVTVWFWILIMVVK